MEIILLQDVKALGKKGEKVNVSEGYARNFILPKKLGIEVNAKNMNDLKLQKAHQDKLAAEALANAKELAKELEASKERLQDPAYLMELKKLDYPVTEDMIWQARNRVYGE